MAARKLVSLKGAILWFVLLSAVLGAIFSYLALQAAAHRMIDGAMSEAVEVRSKGVLRALGRELSDEWLSLQALASQVSSEDRGRVRLVMDQMVAAGDKVSWVGFASLDGKVQTASRGLLEGADVSERPWFRRGLDGNFAGDVHEAVLLAKLLDPEGDNPPRFIDYAMPVRDADGNRIGVLGLHINFDWAATLVDEMSSALDIDTLLVSQDGTVIVSTLDTDPARLNLEPFRLAALGATQSVRATWPDGGTYFSVVRPVEASAGIPGFGWRLIVRVDNDQFSEIDAGLPAQLLPFVLGMLGLLATATLLFIRIYASPFQAAARNATEIAAGADVFPFESSRTQELSQLSAAIARLQALARKPLSGGRD